MRPDYQNMTMAGLMDLLAQETQKFTQYMMDKEYGPEYDRCKGTIQQIQAAIMSRQEGMAAPTASELLLRESGNPQDIY